MDKNELIENLNRLLNSTNKNQKNIEIPKYIIEDIIKVLKETN